MQPITKLAFFNVAHKAVDAADPYRNQCEIHVDPLLGERAKLPLDRMLAFQAS